MFSFSSMKTRFIAIIVGVSLVSIFVLGAIFTYEMIQMKNGEIRDFRKEAEAAVEMRLKQETEIAVSVIDQMHKAQVAGKMTEPTSYAICAMMMEKDISGLILIRV